MTFSYCLLPDRSSGVSEFTKNPREYTTAVIVDKKSSAVDKTIEEAGLRHLPGLFLFAVEREGALIPAVPSDFKIKAEDILLFAGVVENLTFLLEIDGLSPATNQIYKLSAKPSSTRSLVEASVAPHSPIVGKSIRQCKFRTRYNAAVIAVHRHGEKIHSKIGDIVLKAGDTLLLVTSPKFLEEHQHNANFALVREVSTSLSAFQAKAKIWKMVLAVFLAAVMIALATADVLPLLAGALGVSCLMVLTKIISIHTASKAVNGPILIVIAAAFGLATALEKTNAATTIAASILSLLDPIGPLGILFGLYICVAVMSSVISNAAAVALMFPIIAAAVEASPDLQIKTALFVLMFAGSSSFSTPIGYQTNLMVTGPGGYKFTDFLVFGLPLQIIAMVVSVVGSFLVW
eukprot:CAMPEP_0174267412 /NCGR_PEP_ID=MMETSP0439-20130205/33514_1 /TAXON_ID=0 /ORGANISM="Stereomyxa ramosa, Strain Chinc5" /LENGTH=403 /DNA_ID=CAMNT_0015354883 /DNA_START=693 /DNA_END=1901 /DNA_ORIENTATION=-